MGLRDLDFATDRTEVLDAIERTYAAEVERVGAHLVPANQRSESR